MKMLAVSDLLIKAIQCVSDSDFRNAIRFTLESERILRSKAERDGLLCSFDRYLELLHATLTSMQFQVSKEELRKELIFDIQRLVRLSNQSNAEVSRWMVWCMDDYLSLTGKSCKEFIEFKRRYFRLVKQKST